MSCVNGLLLAFADQFSIRMYTEHFILVLSRVLSTRLHYFLVFETPHRSNELYANEYNLELFYCWFYYCQRFRCCRFHSSHETGSLTSFIYRTNKKNLLHFKFVNSTFNSRMATRNFCEIIFFYTCVFLISLFIECRRTDIRFSRSSKQKPAHFFFSQRSSTKIFVCIEILGRMSI